MKPTTVTITKGKHASQKYTVLIQPPKGEAYKLRQRYARVYTAKRGALRNLDGCKMTDYRSDTGVGIIKAQVYYQTGKGVPIKFVIK